MMKLVDDNDTNSRNNNNSKNKDNFIIFFEYFLVLTLKRKYKTLFVFTIPFFEKS